MIVLDTNVLSELLRGERADPHVLRWVRALSEQPVTTVVNRCELLAGVAMLPAGVKRDRLHDEVGRLLRDLEIALPLTHGCPEAYAEIVARRRRAGRPIGGMDALIASIARTHRVAVATRDVGGFEGLDLRLVDPWQVSGPS